MPPKNLRVLVLQHPQEKHHPLGSVPVLLQELGDACTLKIGLSWRNLSAVLGEEAPPSQWSVLHLGSFRKDPSREKARPWLFVDRKNKELPVLPQGKMQGVVVLDGTWSQAKALWWRNAWLLKLNRLVLLPERPSLYGKLRKEPRKECLSTLEAAAFALEALGDSATSARLLRAFEAHIALKRQKKAQPSE